MTKKNIKKNMKREDKEKYNPLYFPHHFKRSDIIKYANQKKKNIISLINNYTHTPLLKIITPYLHFTYIKTLHYQK